MSSHSYPIIGCVHFGSRAVEKLLKKDLRSKITVVDKNKKALQKVSHLPIETIVFDGRRYLNRLLSTPHAVDFITPGAPYHVAFEFILSQLKPMGAKRAKVPPLSALPNPRRGKTGDLYASIADFICPEECPEPSRCCTVPRKRRDKPLYKMLRDLEGPFDSKVIHSQQLGLGVGGFKPEALMGLMEEIKKGKSTDFEGRGSG